MPSSCLDRVRELDSHGMGLSWKFDWKRGVLACIDRQSSLLETGLGLVMHERGVRGESVHDLCLILSPFLLWAYSSPLWNAHSGSSHGDKGGGSHTASVCFSRVAHGDGAHSGGVWSDCFYVIGRVVFRA